MNLIRIAARIAARIARSGNGSQNVNLPGPFVPGGKSDAEVTIPFGFVGPFADLVAKTHGFDASDISSGPVEDVPIGYEIDVFSQPSVKSKDPYQPDDSGEFELNLKIVSIFGITLSEAARQILDQAGLTEEVKAQVENAEQSKHLQGNPY